MGLRETLMWGPSEAAIERSLLKYYQESELSNSEIFENEPTVRMTSSFLSKHFCNSVIIEATHVLRQNVLTGPFSFQTFSSTFYHHRLDTLNPDSVIPISIINSIINSK